MTDFITSFEISRLQLRHFTSNMTVSYDAHFTLVSLRCALHTSALCTIKLAFKLSVASSASCRIETKTSCLLPELNQTLPWTQGQHGSTDMSVVCVLSSAPVPLIMTMYARDCHLDEWEHASTNVPLLQRWTHLHIFVIVISISEARIWGGDDVWGMFRSCFQNP